MAGVTVQSLSQDALVTEMLLGKLAQKFYPQHLHRFATVQLGMEAAEFTQLEFDAGQDAWRRAFSVLQTWYRQTVQARTIRDLSLLLEEAERLGFVQHGTHEDLLSGRVLHPKFLEKSHNGPHPDFREMLTSWYTDIDWQNLLLFPWMDQDTLLLSEAYTDLEIDRYSGRGIKTETKATKHYSELFTEKRPEGTRILVKGDPGTGKTTFTHKLAFDWATGHLDLFDTVFVVKVKFAEKSQTIESMIKNQIGSIGDIGEPVIGEYLKSGMDRVLLVLDGLDEIKVKNYPKILEVLQGKAYRKCSTLVTTRPYVDHDIQNKMTAISKINGFSEERADLFLSHILPEEDRKEFFSQLKKKKISDLQSAPLVMQALALLFKEDRELPATFTMTFDQLVFFLQKTCEVTKDLSQEEIQEAMAEVAELAFKGLTRDDKQLVFSRNEIKNDNIFKLGILTAEKTGSGFKPVTILQFPHKTFQENSAADHIAKKLQTQDRRPWQTILQQFQALKHESRDHATPTLTSLSRLHNVPDDPRPNNLDLSDARSTLQDDDAQFTENLAGIETGARRIFDAMETYINAMLQQGKEPPPPEGQRDNVSEKKLEARSVIQEVKDLLLLPVGQTLTDPQNRKHYVTRDNYAFLLERVESFKTLFSFIVGKLPEDLAREVLIEIAHVVVLNAVDEEMGNTLPTEHVARFLDGLAREKLPEDDVTEGSLFWPVLLTWDWLQPDALSYMPTGKYHGNSSILDIKSSKFHKVSKEFLQTVTKQLQSLKGVLICKLTDLYLEDLTEYAIQQFGVALYGSSLAALELFNVNQHLVRLLLERLPPSMRKLTLLGCSVPPGTQLVIPPIIHLASLTLEDSTVKIQHLFASLFSTVFPKLKLFVVRGCHMDRDDVMALRNALKAGRVPQLEELILAQTPLTGHAQALADMLRCPHMRSAEFTNTSLSLADGQILLEAILDGALDHVDSLKLVNNPEMEPLEGVLRDTCDQRGISLQCYTFDKMMDINRAMPFLALLREEQEQKHLAESQQ